MGECFLAKGDRQGALLHWHKALDLEPADPDTHLCLAMMFDAENHIQSAIDEYKQYIRYSRDQMEVAKVKKRVKMLELKLHPAEPETYPKLCHTQRETADHRGF